MTRGPLSRLVPVENAAMPDRTVIQWDKDDLDALGLMKVDVLALGMLSAIRRMLADRRDALRSSRSACTTFRPRIPATYEMICHADTHGRVPDRIARADGHAAAPAAALASTTW